MIYICKLHWNLGLRVVRLSAKSRESTVSSIDHLTLHMMVKNLDAADKKELRKYQLLKDELGQLDAADNKRSRYNKFWNHYHHEIILGESKQVYAITWPSRERDSTRG